MPAQRDGRTGAAAVGWGPTIRRWWRSLGSGVFMVATLATLAGCELAEVSITEPENVLIAEIYLRAGVVSSDEASAFLQWTLGSRETVQLADARIRLTRGDGTEVAMVRDPDQSCLSPETQDEVEGVCFQLPPRHQFFVRPGDRVTATVELPDGRRLQGATDIPSDLVLFQPGIAPCALPPAENLELIWHPVPGAWSYAVEATIYGLRDALAPLGIEVEQDTLALAGYAISESDTTLVFPKELGVFDRFDLERELALVLQEGLPLGSKAEVTVAALDRNYVNWVRGGSFNPSGQVRIPSLWGDGTGVVASLNRTKRWIFAREPGGSFPACRSGG